jgi:small conductance mechanosensitive channel
VTERRVDMEFGISYSDDIEQAQQVLEDIVSSHPKVLREPAPVIRLSALADSSVNFICRPWARPADYWDVYWDVTKAVKQRFDAAGIGIPFPQRDVHLYVQQGDRMAVDTALSSAKSPPSTVQPRNDKPVDGGLDG